MVVTIKYQRADAADSQMRALNSFLDVSAIPREDEWWKGRFIGSGGSCHRLKFTMRLKLCVTATVIEGQARGVDFPYQRRESKEFAVIGSINACLADFELHSEGAMLRTTPFVCSGEISKDERRISGIFSLGCFSGFACGCGGGTGSFDLRRINLSGRRQSGWRD